MIYELLTLESCEAKPGCVVEILVPFRNKDIVGLSFRGVRACDVERVQVRVNGMYVVDIGMGVDEEGVPITAGQALKAMNGMEGLHQNGGRFSIMFGRDSEGRRVSMNTMHCCEVRIYLGAHAVPGVRVVMDVLLPYGWRR